MLNLEYKIFFLRVIYLNISFDFLSGLSLILISAVVFAILIVLLFLYILIYQGVLRARQKQLDRWSALADKVIYKVIFHEKDDPNNYQGEELFDIVSRTVVKISPVITKYLKNKNFRKILTQKLISVKLNMSGIASDNLTRLFRQLELDNHILEMLNSSSWSKIASAIQQIGIMELDEYKARLFEFVDNKRGLIRVEAQNAILKFYKFEGLRFLDNATYPITEWQQIKLLNQLADLPTENFTGIDVWLDSQNDTIVLFALKLVKNYHRFELYDKVVACLKHKNSTVRKQAIIVLKFLPSERSAALLIDIYFTETSNNQLAILHTLASIGSENEIQFLVALLSDDVNAVKIASAKALALLGQAGIEAIQSHIAVKEYPLAQILAQIKEEAA
jgi:hypothetical protein